MELSEDTLGQSEDQVAREFKYMRLEIKECKTQTCSVPPPKKGREYIKQGNKIVWKRSLGR